MLRALMCPAGPRQMATDATYAAAAEPPWSPWHAVALCLFAEAQLLLGDTERATALFEETCAVAADLGNVSSVVVSRSELAGLAMDRGRWPEATEHLRLALDTVDESRLHDYPLSAPAFVAAARLAVHRGDPDEVDRQLGAGHAGPAVLHLRHPLPRRPGPAATGQGVHRHRRPDHRTPPPAGDRRHRPPPAGPGNPHRRSIRIPHHPHHPYRARRKRPADHRSRPPSFGFSPTCRPTSRSARSGSGCSCPATPSAPKSARSTANWASPPAATPSSTPPRSACSPDSPDHGPAWYSKALSTS